MPTNTRDPRTTDRPVTDGPVDTHVVEPVPGAGVTPTGGVAVFDRPTNSAIDPTLHPGTTPVVDSVPVETRSTSSVLAWIVGAIVIVILAYFLLQIIF